MRSGEIPIGYGDPREHPPFKSFSIRKSRQRSTEDNSITVDGKYFDDVLEWTILNRAIHAAHEADSQCYILKNQEMMEASSNLLEMLTLRNKELYERTIHSQVFPGGDASLHYGSVWTIYINDIVMEDGRTYQEYWSAQ